MTAAKLEEEMRDGCEQFSANHSQPPAAGGVMTTRSVLKGFASGGRAVTAKMWRLTHGA